MPIQTNGLSHLALRVTDLARAKRFYAETLGFPVVLEQGDIVLVNANGVLLGMRGGNPATAPGDRFDPYRVGIDHLALAVADPGVRHNGVEDDPTTGGRYISFYDPDGIAWELYFLPSA